MPAEPIGDLGRGLRPPLVRGPPNSNNIVYNIIFSFEKKNTYISLVCKREDYKRPISHLEKKKKNEARFSHLSDMKSNAITVSLAW